MSVLQQNVFGCELNRVTLTLTLKVPWIGIIGLSGGWLGWIKVLYGNMYGDIIQSVLRVSILLNGMIYHQSSICYDLSHSTAQTLTFHAVPRTLQHLELSEMILVPK